VHVRLVDLELVLNGGADAHEVGMGEHGALWIPCGPASIAKSVHILWLAWLIRHWSLAPTLYELFERKPSQPVLPQVIKVLVWLSTDDHILQLPGSIILLKMLDVPNKVG
jgi:hypothetical protein